MITTDILWVILPRLCGPSVRVTGKVALFILKLRCLGDALAGEYGHRVV